MRHQGLWIHSKTIRKAEDPEHEYYVPGFLLPKIGFILLTAGIVAIALVDMLPKLWIIATGESTYAEVTEVIRTEPDRTSTVYRNDAEAREVNEEDDRSPIFHNTLAFRLEDGSRVETRLQRGSRLKPPYSILDESGLPTTIRISYRPSDPQTIVVPFSLSTWFFPVIIIMFGLASLVVAILLLVKATTPLQVPNLQAPPGDNLADTEKEG